MNIPSAYPRKRPRIEIIPLIDIVFFLLATFVMVSLSMVKNQGVPVHLPSADTSTRQAGGEEYTSISITDKGEIYFNKQRVSPAELSVRLKELKRSEKDPLVILNGDEKAFLGRAVLVLDEARKQGIKKFAIAAKSN